ncbi:hypothetical protein [Vibrio owensii]|uniref:hypothetical protein n=1 Tax=Vibrio harveyi group TaxID=717610 RepID=UPI003CC6D632
MKYIDYTKLNSQKKIQFNYNLEKCIEVVIDIIEDEAVRNSLSKLYRWRKKQKFVYAINAVLLFTPLRFLALTAPFYAAAMWAFEQYVKKTLIRRMTEDEKVYDLVQEEKAIIVVER